MPKRTAFTLIELLVVISIIALLIAFLLPALKSAREAAQLAQDLSNARQYALANLTYSNDYAGRYPYTARQGTYDDYGYYNPAVWNYLQRDYNITTKANGRCAAWGPNWTPWIDGKGNVESGWVIFVGRGNNYRIGESNGDPTYVSPQRVSDQPANSSRTMFICRHYLSNQAWGSSFPHLTGNVMRWQNYGGNLPGNVPQLMPTPAGMVVGRLDGSAVFAQMSSLQASKIAGGSAEWKYYLPDR